jgi:hypothetical protein
MRSRTSEAILAAAVLAGAAAAAAPDADALLRAADASRHVLDEGEIRIRATMTKKGEPPGTAELLVQVKGSERMRCTFLDGTQKGREVLAVGPKTWLLVPGASRPVQVSANQKLLGGASLGEIGRLRLHDTYGATIRDGVEAVDGVPCLVLDLQAKERKAQYPKGVLWMGQADRLPRRLTLSLQSGKPAKEIRFTAFDREGGKTVLRRMEVRHLLFSERGTETSLEFLGYEAKAIPDARFEP